MIFIDREKLDMTTSLQSVPEFELEPDEYGTKAYLLGYSAIKQGLTSPGYPMAEGLHTWWTMGLSDAATGKPPKYSLPNPIRVYLNPRIHPRGDA